MLLNSAFALIEAGVLKGVLMTPFAVGPMALVGCLFRRGCPAAVAGGVIPIVVYSVEGMRIRGTSPHVGIEILKIPPPVANGDTPTSVVFEVGLLWVVAPPPHVRPGNPFGRTTQPMCNRSNLAYFYKEAATGPRMASGQLGVPDQHFAPTFAAAIPEQRLVCPAGVLSPDPNLVNQGQPIHLIARGESSPGVRGSHEQSPLE